MKLRIEVWVFTFTRFISNSSVIETVLLSASKTSLPNSCVEEIDDLLETHDSTLHPTGYRVNSMKALISGVSLVNSSFMMFTQICGPALKTLIPPTRVWLKDQRCKCIEQFGLLFVFRFSHSIHTRETWKVSAKEKEKKEKTRGKASSLHLTVYS